MSKLLFFLFLGLISCSSPTVFSDNTDFADGQWFVKQKPVFVFEITDASRPYNLYCNLRNGRSYPYYNLYLRHTITKPSKQVLDQQLSEFRIADTKTGKPSGSGLGSVYDHKFLMMKGYRFPAPGKYTLQIEQFMRQNPLPDVLSVGITVETMP